MDLVQFGGQERVDLADLSYALNDVPTGLLNELSGGFISAPGDTSIIQGFVPGAATANGPVTVGQDGSPNTAWLAMADGATVTYGVFTPGGTAAQAVDVSTFAAGTYYIYVRFNRSPGEPQNRVFWSSVDGAEYAKLSNTRLVGSWEVRIETAQPSPEWLQIGKAVITSAGQGQGNLVAVTDLRPLYFEGSASGNYAPTWGAASDRLGRQASTLTSLRQTIDALKACLVDLKGPGIATWYQSQISGMNVGPSFPLGTPAVANTIAIGDPTVKLQAYSAFSGSPGLNLQIGTTTYFQFQNTGQVLRLVNGTPNFYINPNGSVCIGQQNLGYPLMVNSQSNFTGGELGSFWNRGSGGGRIGMWSSDRIQFSSAMQMGYTSEWPTPRVLWSMGTVNGQIQLELDICNNMGTGLFYPVFRVASNSQAANDFTTYLQSNIVSVGLSSGSTRLYGDTKLYGATHIGDTPGRLVGGSNGFASGVYTMNAGGGGQANMNPYSGIYAITYGGQPNPAGSNDVKYIRLSFAGPLPNPCTVVCSPLQYAADGVEQKKWTLTWRQVDAQTLDFAFADQNGSSQWGSFSFLVLN